MLHGHVMYRHSALSLAPIGSTRLDSDAQLISAYLGAHVASKELILVFNDSPSANVEPCHSATGRAGSSCPYVENAETTGERIRGLLLACARPFSLSSSSGLGILTNSEVDSGIGDVAFRFGYGSRLFICPSVAWPCRVKLRPRMLGK